MTQTKNVLKTGDALLLIDVQKCFCPGGSLAVEGGDEVVPILNRWIESARENGIPIYVSRDFHPKNHVSFEKQGGDWPPHCIQDTDDARFHPGLQFPADGVKVTKGVHLAKDQNSAFDRTGLAELLRMQGVQRLWVGGLARDVCVLESVLDARREGFEVVVIKEGTRPVDPEEGRKAIAAMEEAGAVIFEHR